MHAVLIALAILLACVLYVKVGLKVVRDGPSLYFGLVMARHVHGSGGFWGDVDLDRWKVQHEEYEMEIFAPVDVSMDDIPVMRWLPPMTAHEIWWTFVALWPITAWSYVAIQVREMDRRMKFYAPMPFKPFKPNWMGIVPGDVEGGL